MIESPNISRIQERDSDPIINRETGERNSLFYTFLEMSKDIEIIQDDLDLTSADMVFTKIDMDTADEIKKACGRNTPVGYLIFFKAIEQARTLLERKIKDIEKGSDKDLFEETLKLYYVKDEVDNLINALNLYLENKISVEEAARMMDISEDK